MEVISKETIKPSSPTPPHLRIYALNFIDHILAPSYVPLVFFYSTTSNQFLICDEISKLLKKSLSQLLSMYYPLAGRLRDQVSIDCNDEGVTFFVTHIKHNLSKILQNPKQEFINPLFGDQLHWKTMEANASFLVIQLNHFACGGMAISVCMSHKVADAFTLSNFIKDWASLTKNNGESPCVITAFPVLNASSAFPRGDLPIFPEYSPGKRSITTVCKRLVFDASKIKCLKAMMISQRVENPTRVQVVGAFVYKCAISALKNTNNNNQLMITTCLNVPVNLRPRMVPPLPEKSVGNMSWGFNVLSNIEEEEGLELHEMVRKIQQGLSSFCDTYVKRFGLHDMSFISECLKAVTTKRKNDMVVYILTSWCRFGTYEVDFGWGKPKWVTTMPCPVKNIIVLMDTRDGEGIEALVNMEEKELILFERNVELLGCVCFS